MSKRTDILGIMINNLNEDEFHHEVITSIKNNKRQIIFTPNPNIILSSRKDETLRDIINFANINLADGIGVVIASKILHSPLPCRLSGIDAGEFLLEYAAKNSLSLFILGGRSSSLKNAKKKIKMKYESINICGTHNGYFEAKDNDKIIRQINKCKPDILFACMGFPRQEKWIYENADKIPSLKIAIGLGGSIDVWSGRLKRAPHIIRSLCLEWLWRMILEPKRLKNLKDIPCFLYLAIYRSLKIYKNYIINGDFDH